jgi:squalene synthase HpnC
LTIRSAPYTSEEAVAVPPFPGTHSILHRRRGENFPVALGVLARPLRRHLLAFYGFARLADELGDSYPGDRLAALDQLERDTVAALAGRPAPDLVAAAAGSVRQLEADAAPLFDLIEANRRDQLVSRYETFEELLGYCRLSANPVGRLVLAAFGRSAPREAEWSDAICTGLQLVEHLQDLGEDAAAGRIYLPGEDVRRFEVAEEELTGRVASSRLRALVCFEAARARRYLDAGLPLVGALRGGPKLAVAGFWAGGRAALDAVAAADFDVLAGPARPRPARLATLALSALRASRRAGEGP